MVESVSGAGQAVLILFAAILVSFVISIFIWAAHLDGYLNFDKEIGINHLGIVFHSGGGGDFSLENLDKDELIDRLYKDWQIFHTMRYPCINTSDKSHLAEYRYITRFNDVKTVGYITKDGACYKNKYFKFVEVND